METLLVILIFALGTSVILHAMGTGQDDGDIMRWEHLLSIILSLICLFAMVTMYGVLRDTPTALDVYQGNTEMEYTVVMKGNDTISIDSTVIFKN